MPTIISGITGYKNHIKSDQKSKFIEKYTVTDASVHDSTLVPDIMKEKDADQEMFGDSCRVTDRVNEFNLQIISVYSTAKG